MINRIGLVIRPGSNRVLAVAREVVAWCQARNLALDVCPHTAKSLKFPDGGVSSKEMVERADPIITLAGDGTLIGIARHVEGASPVFIGVNFGNLGFLTEVRPDEIFPVLESVLTGEVKCAERVLLEVQVDLAVNGHDVARIRADGIIVATPTGSTAYSLAAGGSIAHPALSVILVTPICPHSLTNRPLILPGTATVKIELPRFDDEMLVTVDGQLSERLVTGDIIKVSQAKQTVKFVVSREKSYFDILRTKLNWGVPNRPG